MLSVSFHDRIAAVPAAAWNEVCGTDHPFTRHEFLNALETSGAVSTATGWQPCHATVYRRGELVAAMPLYRKSHSWGEYVFDWNWAEAAGRAGIAWYPKLVGAIPFTPATGPRLCVAPGEAREPLVELLSGALRKRLAERDVSSLHILFPDALAAAEWAAAGLSVRHGAQYHWCNEGYADFPAFLAKFSSRKRKNVRRERERVAEQGLQLRIVSGDDITPALWRQFYRFYQMTYLRHSGHAGYLNEAFFQALGSTMGAHAVMVVAERDGRLVAGALSLRDSSTLYGRYWGCLQEFDQLHFEACYYQGIEYCIREGLTRFDPGAQGEHKIQRGFTPVTTYSCHWIEHLRLRRAVDDFLVAERRHMADYLDAARTALPFRKEME